MWHKPMPVSQRERSLYIGNPYTRVNDEHLTVDMHIRNQRSYFNIDAIAQTGWMTENSAALTE